MVEGEDCIDDVWINVVEDVGEDFEWEVGDVDVVDVVFFV